VAAGSNLRSRPYPEAMSFAQEGFEILAGRWAALLQEQGARGALGQVGVKEPMRHRDGAAGNPPATSDWPRPQQALAAAAAWRPGSVQMEGEGNFTRVAWWPLRDRHTAPLAGRKSTVGRNQLASLQRSPGAVGQTPCRGRAVGLGERPPPAGGDVAAVAV